MGFDQEHIVMLPFLALGHLIPFLALAKQIQHRTGFRITIATTPLNAQYLLLAAQPNNNIHFAELPFLSQDYGMPPNTENTENIPLNLIIKLGTATQHLEKPTRRLLSHITEQQGKPPLCLISDVFYGWAVNVANSSGTVNVAFSTFGAYGMAAYMSMWLHLPHCNRKVSSDDEEFQLPGFPERCRLKPSQLHPLLRAADGTDSWSRYFRQQISFSMKSLGWLCNTVEGIEPFGLEVLRNNLKLPVWSILASNISRKKHSGKKIRNFDREMHRVAGLARFRFGGVYLVWVYEYDQLLSDDRIGHRFGKEREALCLGHKADCRARPEGRVPT